MARTIGVKYKNMIKRIVEAEQAKGNIGITHLENVVNQNLPAQAWETWESAYDEINRIVGDLACKRMANRI